MKILFLIGLISTNALFGQVLPYPEYSNSFYLLPIMEAEYRVPFGNDSNVFTETTAFDYKTNFKSKTDGPFFRHGFDPVVRYMGEMTGADNQGDIGKKTYDYTTTFVDLERRLKGTISANAPFGVQLNGNRWDFGGRGTIGFIRSHELNIWDRIDTGRVDQEKRWLAVPKIRWMMRNKDNSMLMHSDNHALICNSRYATVHRVYKRRNTEALVVKMNEYWVKHPRLFSGIDGDSETEQPTEYNPLTLLEFEDWKANKGIYNPQNLTVSLWYHLGQTGVKDVVFEPTTKNITLLPTNYVYKGNPDLSDAEPGYGLLQVSLASLGGGSGASYEDAKFKYTVVGGEDDGKIYSAKGEYFGDQGRKGGAGDYDHFMTAVNDHIIEDYIKWMYLKFVKLGQKPDDVRAHLYSHEVGVNRNHVIYDFYDDSKSTTLDSKFGSSGITKYNGISAAIAQKVRDNSQDGYKNWGNFEWNPKKGDYLIDLDLHLQYGAHIIAPNGWSIPGFDIHKNAGYVSMAERASAALAWKPWSLGANNSTTSQASRSYLPTKTLEVTVAKTGANTYVVSWSPFIYSDLPFLWKSWPDFVSYRIIQSGKPDVNTTSTSVNLTGDPTGVTVMAVAKKGTGAAQGFGKIILPIVELTRPSETQYGIGWKTTAAAESLSLGIMGGHNTKSNLNTFFDVEYQLGNKWISMKDNLKTHFKYPHNLRLSLQQNKFYQFGDYQALRFYRTEHDSFKEISYQIKGTWYADAYFEMWAGADGEEGRMVSDRYSANVVNEKKGLIPSDTWFEFRMVIGDRETERIKKTRFTNTQIVFAEISDIRISYLTTKSPFQSLVVNLKPSTGLTIDIPLEQGPLQLLAGLNMTITGTTGTISVSALGKEQVLNFPAEVTSLTPTLGLHENAKINPEFNAIGQKIGKKLHSRKDKAVYIKP